MFNGLILFLMPLVYQEFQVQILDVAIPLLNDYRLAKVLKNLIKIFKKDIKR